MEYNQLYGKSNENISLAYFKTRHHCSTETRDLKKIEDEMYIYYIAKRKTNTQQMTG